MATTASVNAQAGPPRVLSLRPRPWQWQLGTFDFSFVDLDASFEYDLSTYQYCITRWFTRLELRNALLKFTRTTRRIKLHEREYSYIACFARVVMRKMYVCYWNNSRKKFIRCVTSLLNFSRRIPWEIRRDPCPLVGIYQRVDDDEDYSMDVR